MTAVTVASGTDVADRHPGWQVWRDRATAVRTVANRYQPARNDDTYRVTVEASGWPELDDKLAEQDTHDAELAAGP